ncbi:beta strand repeat-containing protein [Spartinivicinus poritis]|uniref:Ig-like domain-containing protein n=1 Tax=Spartinivicinus poritis TaxID=2994640 RepID=A0ABT5U9C7_9GAMM|nr:Ig-like domain-containing protein [Spartinivicinus sp. A2-2]MDE1461759.1 Ig-like domain-containing protein [Spartinivicinus sp. A2-2]
MAAQNQPTDFAKSLSDEATATALLLAGSQLMQSSQVYSKGNIEEKFGQPKVVDQPFQHTGENLKLGSLFELNQTTSSEVHDYSQNVTAESSKAQLTVVSQPAIFSSAFLNKLSATGFAPVVNVEERTAEEIANPVIYRDDSETISRGGYASSYATASPVLETISHINQPLPHQAETQASPSQTELVESNSLALAANSHVADNKTSINDVNSDKSQITRLQAPVLDSNSEINNTEEVASHNQADASPPTTPAMTMSSISNNGGVTSSNTLVFSGTAEANSSVEVFIDGVSIGTTTTDGAGNWSVDHTGTTLADGNYTVTAQATDAAGNVSALSAGLPITIDTSGPAAPAITNISNDTGASNADEITSDNTLVFSGTAEANSSVEVFIDGVSIGTTTADGSGNWSVDHTGTTLADGNYTITARATDAAGNVSALSAGLPITVDTSGPAAPAITGISNDTGASNADEITSDNTLVFSGTAEANSSVEVFIDGVSIGTTTADGSGNWNVDHTGTTLADGNYTLTAQATDAASNVSGLSAGLPMTIDTSGPAAPTVTGISNDTGASNADEVTSDNTLVFSGTAEANSSVEVFIDGVSIGTTTADGAGNWSVDHTSTTLADGNYTLTARATDAAGNVSALSTGLLVTVDTSGPAAPTITGISNDTGASNADEITSDNTLVFSGTAEANSSVEVFIGGVSIGTTTADGSGSWSVDHTGTALADGNYTLTARATDVAGNVSALSAGLPITIDTSGPAAPAVTGISADTGSSNSDEITSDNTLVFSGTAEANSSVEVFIDGVSIGTTTADGAGNWSVDHTGATLADGNYTLTARATDAAGNVSALSAGLPMTIDTSGPAAPSITGISNDTGASNADEVTSDNTLVFSGTAEANSSVEVFIDGVSIGTTTADGAGNWSVDHTSTTLADGNYTLTARATDAAGNVSALSTGLLVTVDTSGPAAPTITGISNDTGASNADEITSDNTLVFSGTAEANSSVEVFIGGVSIGTTTADGSGSWSVDHTGTALADGNYTLTARATDVAGNVSALSAGLPITIDTSGPAAPAVTGISADTGSSNSDEITSDNTLVFSGTAEANSSVEVFIDGVSIGTTTAGGAGNWSVDHTDTTLTDGNYIVTARATDAAGNVSPLSAGLPMTIDTSGPAAPSITGISNDTGASNADEITSDNTLVFSGTAEANSSVEVFIDGVSIGTTTTDGSGNWSVDHTSTTLADGNHTLTARATDAAGNVSALSSGLPVTIDTTNPTFNNSVFSLAENSASSTTVGTASGTDTTTLSYSFSNDTQTSSDGYFQIDANTGAITLTAAGATADLLNYEAGANSVQHNVKTTDLAGNQTTAQVTINITDVNEAPTIANNTVTAVENTTYTFSASNFKFTDVDAGSALASVKITSLPVSGQLLLNGSAVSINDEISISDINNNLLAYQPANGVSGSQAATFNYQVSDGTNWSSNSAQMDMDILNTITGTAPASQSSNITIDVNNYTTTNQGFQASAQKVNLFTGALQAGNIDAYGSEGFGIDALTLFNEWNTKLDEISYSTIWNKSEVMTIDFDQDMTDSTVNFARLYSSDNEVGHWEAYKDGALVGQGDFNGTSDGQGSFNIVVGGGFDQVKFTALMENGESQGSSYLVNSITGNTVIHQTGGEDTLTGTSAGDYMAGLGGNDILSGGGGDDLIIGGSGADTLTGGTGADTFDWNLNDQGTLASPTTDTIMDFNIAENDVLHLQDLLVGETQGTLDQFLTVSASGGDTTIDVAHNGDGQVTQKIVLDNVDLTSHYGTSNSSTIISNLVSDGSLLTD